MSVFDAKTNLSKLIELAVGGDQVVITNRGKPIVELVPHIAQTQNGYGVLRGVFSTDTWEQEDSQFNETFNRDKFK